MINNNRIELVDALRGFALLGIMLLHAIEHFDFIWQADLNPEIFHKADPHVSRTIYLLFSGKAYSIFALMFGFSFFVQMDRAESKGVDFRLRFFWRLVLLLVIGYIFSLVYIGQILVIYALMGMPLILFYRFNKKILVLLVVLFMLQIPTIVNIISSYTNPEFALQNNNVWQLWGEAGNTFANGSFMDVVRFNSWKGHNAVFLWSYYNGRYLQLFGLFLLGLILGKGRFFENFNQYKNKILLVFIISAVIFAALQTLLVNFSSLEIPNPRSGLYHTLIKSYADLSLTSSYISLIIIIFQRVKSVNNSSLLAYYGRMSLTNYIVQPLIGTSLFYGYGFALYHYFGPTLSLFYGIVFFCFQLWYSRLWMKHFYYGPFEWLWRALTFFNFNLRFKKTLTEQIVSGRDKV